jgi:hypothetical protein
MMIFTKLINAQQHELQIARTEFYPNRKKCKGKIKFPGTCILSDDERSVRPKHVTVLVIKSWETKSCVGLVGTY